MTVENTHAQAQGLVGKRVEIPVHYDMWMRGARFGRVTGWRKGKPGKSCYVMIKLDHPQARKAQKVWALDFDYLKVL